MPVRCLLVVGLVVVGAVFGLVAGQGVASAATSAFFITAKQCTDGGGKVVFYTPAPTRGSGPQLHQPPQKLCSGGKYDLRSVQ